MIFLFFLLLVVAFFLLFIIWFPLLMWGIILWMEKEKIGIWMSVIYGFWGLWLVSFIFTRHSPILLIEKMTLLFFPFFMWIPLLVLGVLLFWSRKKDSIKMVVFSMIWGVVAYFVFASYNAFSFSPDPKTHTQQFIQKSYQGAIATLELPYTGPGKLILYPNSLFMQRGWWPFYYNSRCTRLDVFFSETHRIIIPAGIYNGGTVEISSQKAHEIQPFIIKENDVLVLNE